MSVTIKDIARESGMSISAVSLVLNDRPCRISQEKKEQIRQIARLHHYEPNQVARSLVTKKTRMLALILPDIENAFFSSLAKRIVNRCRQEGYLLIIANSNDQYSQDRELLRNIAARGVDGLFLIASNESYLDNAALLKDLQKLPIPYVMVDRVYDGFACDRVLFDNELGARLAVRHLLSMGHTRIGCVSNMESNNGRARLQGYRNALREANLEYTPAYVAKGDYHFDSGFAAAQALLQTDVTAAFVGNDMMALGFLKYLYNRGLRVPEDFSLVGYDNSLSPFVLGVALTSVAQDPQLLGEEACRLLIDKLREKNAEPQAVCLTPELVVRNSVRRLTKPAP